MIKRSRKILIIAGIAAGALILAASAIFIAFSLHCMYSKNVLEAAIKGLEEAGEPTKIASMIPPEIPDDENAAVIYNEAFELLEKLDAECREEFSNNKIWNELLSEVEILRKHKEDAQAIVEKLANVVKLLKKASKRPKCRFAVDYEAGFAALLPHISKLIHCGKLLPINTNLHYLNKNYAEAAESLETQFKLAEALLNDPILVSYLLHRILYGIAYETLQDIMNEGLHIINHGGHSSSAYNMNMGVGDVDELTNSEYFLKLARVFNRKIKN